MDTEGSSSGFDAGVERFWKAAVGGTLVALPVVAGSAMGASVALLFAYLCIVVVALTIVLLRRKFRRR